MYFTAQYLKYLKTRHDNLCPKQYPFSMIKIETWTTNQPYSTEVLHVGTDEHG